MAEQVKKEMPESEPERLVKVVDGGVVVEDDGGFVNFVPDPGPQLGNCLGIGLDD